MLSLAKALIVANNPKIFLDDLKYHGLFTRTISDSLRTYMSDESNWCIEREYAVTNNGVFQELVELIDPDGIRKNTIFNFKNLSSVDPDLRDIYSKYYDEPSNTIGLYKKQQISSDPYITEICPSTLDRARFENQFPVFKTEFDFQEILHGQSLRYTSNDRFSRPPESFRICESIQSREFLVAAARCEYDDNISKIFISPQLADYIRMFILSNCVRYKPDLWGKIVQGENEGSIGIVNLFISNARIAFPTFILSQLVNEKTEYGVSARW